MDDYWPLRHETYEDDLPVIFRGLGIPLGGCTKHLPRECLPGSQPDASQRRALAIWKAWACPPSPSQVVCLGPHDTIRTPRSGVTRVAFYSGVDISSTTRVCFVRTLQCPHQFLETPFFVKTWLTP
ncbi:hypothetical protein GSI_06670 [Ganoderma sinense ZZ0214-1]|uniref:Uncharacterized protein n=1 Tax=Ganoderma sinense ZZ0214-1 TaxID=1077348 RepID=A0A2G8SDW7_9APHY|nr:hypothetical protein GSI_06670 [Ganoderma sinense ZZ0214-1]